MDTGKCFHCENEVTPCEGLQRVYCDDCRWKYHYSRNWYCKGLTKGEWMTLERRSRR
jgi:hypothetical protein